MPTAELRTARRFSPAWLLPLFAAALAAYLGLAAWGQRGVLVLLHARDGHGIRVGDPVRYRGINVGEVRQVELAEDLSEILLEVRIDGASGALARAGTRFWVVRPRVRLESVQGLETLLGARRLAVIPGPAGAPVQREFEMLAEPPLPGAGEEGGLEILLEAPRRFGLSPGAPVSFRQIPIGTVVSVGLTSDATAVEARARIRAPYRELVRESSRFWEVGGLELSLGIGGLNISIESARSLLVGGVAMATPTDPGDPVRTGHRFRLRDEPEEEWLEWQPTLGLGNALLPDGVPRPTLLRARTDWDAGFFHRARSAEGWLLPVGRFVIGPADLLAPDVEEAAIEVRGERLPLNKPFEAEDNGLVPPLPQLAGGRELDTRPHPRHRGGGGRPGLARPRHLAQGPCGRPPGRAPTTGWSVDPAISFDADWHGAAVLARSDGKVVGHPASCEDGQRDDRADLGRAPGVLKAQSASGKTSPVLPPRTCPRRARGRPAALVRIGGRVGVVQVREVDLGPFLRAEADAKRASDSITKGWGISERSRPGTSSVSKKAASSSATSTPRDHVLDAGVPALPLVDVGQVEHRAPRSADHEGHGVGELIAVGHHDGRHGEVVLQLERHAGLHDLRAGGSARSPPGGSRDRFRRGRSPFAACRARGARAPRRPRARAGAGPRSAPCARGSGKRPRRAADVDRSRSRVGGMLPWTVSSCSREVRRGVEEPALAGPRVGQEQVR